MLLLTPDNHKKVSLSLSLCFFSVFSHLFCMLFLPKITDLKKKKKKLPNECLCRKEIFTCLIKCLNEDGFTPLFLNYYQSIEYTIYSDGLIFFLFLFKCSFESDISWVRLKLRFYFVLSEIMFKSQMRLFFIFYFGFNRIIFKNKIRILS